ncbi:MAG: hypothetical protein WC438_04210 [Candidatus Pacearchaeota archaeon]
MKTQISITIEREMLEKAQEKLKEGLFRNQSHLFEYSLKKFLEDEEDK